jgi:hypothetical protein
MAKRLSLSLGAGEQAVLEPFIEVGTKQHRALQHWAFVHGLGPVSSEAAALRVLLQIGAETLRDDVLDAGYAELARSYAGDAERAERRTARDRYVARTEATVQA